MAVGKGVTQEFVKLNLDQFTEELKTNWLLVVELSVLHGLFDERKEQNGTRHFLKARVARKANKTRLALSCLRCQLFNSRFVGYVFFPPPFKCLMSCASKAELEHINGL